MADDFMKGLALFALGGLGWFTFAGWYRTPTYYIVTQLVGEAEGVNSVYDEVALFAGDAFFWLMVLGPLTFWVLLPAFREFRRSRSDDAAN